MKHWLMTFRPDTYALVKEHGVIGVRSNHKRRFAELADGDRFVAYVTRQQRLDGHGEIVGRPFQDTMPIFGGKEPYAERCRVRFAESGVMRNIVDALWFLETFAGEMKTTPTNAIFCNGGFVQVTEKDYAWLLRLLRGEEKPPLLEWRAVDKGL